MSRQATLWQKGMSCRISSVPFKPWTLACCPACSGRSAVATSSAGVSSRASLGQGLLPPAPRVESASFHANLAMVSQTRLLTVAPSSAVQRYSAAGSVRELPLAQPLLSSAMNFVAHRDVWETASVQTLYRAMVMNVENSSSEVPLNRPR